MSNATIRHVNEMNSAVLSESLELHIEAEASSIHSFDVSTNGGPSLNAYNSPTRFDHINYNQGIPLMYFYQPIVGPYQISACYETQLRNVTRSYYGSFVVYRNQYDLVQPMNTQTPTNITYKHHTHIMGPKHLLFTMDDWLINKPIQIFMCSNMLHDELVYPSQLPDLRDFTHREKYISSTPEERTSFDCAPTFTKVLPIFFGMTQSQLKKYKDNTKNAYIKDLIDTAVRQMVSTCYCETSPMHIIVQLYMVEVQSGRRGRVTNIQKPYMYGFESLDPTEYHFMDIRDHDRFITYKDFHEKGIMGLKQLFNDPGLTLSELFNLNTFPMSMNINQANHWLSEQRYIATRPYRGDLTDTEVPADGGSPSSCASSLTRSSVTDSEYTIATNNLTNLFSPLIRPNDLPSVIYSPVSPAYAPTSPPYATLPSIKEEEESSSGTSRKRTWKDEEKDRLVRDLNNVEYNINYHEPPDEELLYGNNYNE